MNISSPSITTELPNDGDWAARWGVNVVPISSRAKATGSTEFLCDEQRMASFPPRE